MNIYVYLLLSVYTYYTCICTNQLFTKRVRWSGCMCARPGLTLSLSISLSLSLSLYIYIHISYLRMCPCGINAVCDSSRSSIHLSSYIVYTMYTYIYIYIYIHMHVHISSVHDVYRPNTSNCPWAAPGMENTQEVLLRSWMSSVLRCGFTESNLQNQNWVRGLMLARD